MDLNLTPGEQQFRDEFRAWLKANVPAEWAGGAGAEGREEYVKYLRDWQRKLYEGGFLRLIRANVVENRRAEEAKMAAWIAADPKRQQHYGTMLQDLKTLSETTNAAQKRDAIIRHFPDFISLSVFGAMSAAAGTAHAGRQLNDQQKAAITESLAERDPYFEREMLKFFLREFDSLPADRVLRILASGQNPQTAGVAGQLAKKRR